MPLHLQKHFHVNELAELWGASPNTVRRWFENEPGVLKISIGYRRGKDHRVCLSIKASYVYLLKLSRQGLLFREPTSKGIFYRITIRGRKRLAFLSRQSSETKDL